MLDDRYVEIFNLVKAYPNPFGDEIKVVDGFDLKVPRGDVVSIIGHSGCGKSTVLNMIAGLSPISDGGIVVAGKEIDGPGPDRAVVFQAPCLLPWMTSFQNVMLGVKRSYPHASRQERQEMVEASLIMVGLADSMHKYPREMSGGMQQRVGIARAIALKPRMLLLDEPLGRLDSLTRMELQDVILRILDKEKITTMMVTHDPDEAVFMSDRICMMTNGPHAKVGEVMEIDFERPRSREEIMETDLFYDYRRRLLKFLDDCEIEKEQRKHKAKVATVKSEPKSEPEPELAQQLS